MAGKGKGGYVGRGGLKLEHALDAFVIDVTGLRCADLGCSTGGFTDCLLKRGAAHVHAVDTGYGVLDYSLRRDQARVTVHERTNALHLAPPEQVDLVVIDLGWTPQGKAVPAALAWLKDGGRIITLIKPMYEISDQERAAHFRDGVLDDVFASTVARRIAGAMTGCGAKADMLVESPIRGGGSRGRGGNKEWLALVTRDDST